MTPEDAIKQLRQMDKQIIHGSRIFADIAQVIENLCADSANKRMMDALLKWLKAEMLDDEGAMSNARDNGEWDRYKRLEGHREGLLAVVHHLRAEQYRLPSP